VRTIFAWLLVCASFGCGSLPPPNDAREVSVHFADGAATPLGALAATSAQGHEGLTGVRVLDSGADAFTQRLALIESAQRSIDAQYYIWNSDITGQYLAQAIHAAAERGVHVRLLLDDINVAGRDATIAALDSHRNIEVRIYNPFPQRAGVRKVFDLVTDFSRLNRRMHNKSFTVDGVVTIVGGRNIGDEYFDANPDLIFRDRDVVAIGPVVDQIGGMFDAFWNSELTYSISALTTQRLTEAQANERLEHARQTRAPLEALKFELPKDSADAQRIVERSNAAMVWAPVRLVYDQPPRADQVADTSRLQPTAREFGLLAAAARHEILIESAYLVLDEPSLKVLDEIEARGVAVRALTNSLASNDVTPNHAAYARRREAIVSSGIDLYELRPDAASCGTLVTIDGGCSLQRIFGLHAKSFVFDAATLYVGSMNLNLRSAYLNAESALIIDSPELAGSVADAITLNMRPQNSWHVTLGRDGELLWSTQRDGATEEVHREPETSWLRRTASGFIAMLPLEKYL
jgi:cardiolipin synthase C